MNDALKSALDFTKTCWQASSRYFIPNFPGVARWFRYGVYAISRENQAFLRIEEGLWGRDVPAQPPGQAAREMARGRWVAVDSGPAGGEALIHLCLSPYLSGGGPALNLAFLHILTCVLLLVNAPTFQFVTTLPKTLPFPPPGFGWVVNLTTYEPVVDRLTLGSVRRGLRLRHAGIPVPYEPVRCGPAERLSPSA